MCPRDAGRFRATNKALHQAIGEAYRHTGASLVRAGGAWSHLLSKRARDSVHEARSNHEPRALASLVYRVCAVCDEKMLGRVSEWGFLAHPACIRPYLWNTYYAKDEYGFSSVPLPKQILRGFNTHRGQYDYTVVWKEATHGLVPREWTLEGLLENPPPHVEAALRKKRAADEAARAAEEAKRRRLEDLAVRRREALAQREAKFLEAAGGDSQFVRALLRVRGIPTGDYFESRVTTTTKLRDLIPIIEPFRRLLAVLHPHDVITPEMTVEQTARRHVADVLDTAVRRVDAKFRVCVGCRQHTNAQRCPEKMCRRCCRGCVLHRRR